MKMPCLKDAFFYTVYMAQKQSQNHLLLAITSPFSSFCCYFNLTTKISHNYVSSRIIRVHYWKRKHPGKKKQNKTKLPLPPQFFKLSSYLAESCPRDKAIVRSSTCWPWTEYITSVTFRKLLSKTERKVLIAPSSECLFTTLSCWTKKRNARLQYFHS